MKTFSPVLNVKRSKRRALFFITALFSFSAFLLIFSEGDEAQASVELGFSSFSPNGAAGGEILPASCESGYTHGDPNSCMLLYFGVGPSYSPGAEPASINIPYNSSTVLHWYQQIGNQNTPEPPYATFLDCTASGDWSGTFYANNPMYHWWWGGPPEIGWQGDAGTGALTSPKTYNVTCRNQFNDGSIGSKQNTVTVNVASPTGCAYGTDPSGNPLTLLSPSTTSNTYGGRAVPGGQYKAPASFGNYCFRNDSGNSYFVPVNTFPEFNSFWTNRPPGITPLP